MYQAIYNRLPVFFQKSILNAFGYYQMCLRYHNRYFLPFLEYLENNQWKSSDYLLEEQAELMQKLLKHAYENVPYYRAVFNQRKLKPTDFRTLNDLQKLPVLTKELVKKNYKDLIARNVKRKQVIVAESGGTTGAPLKFFLPKEIGGAFNYATLARLHRWAGYDITKGMKRIKLGGRYVANKPPFARYNAAEKQLLLSTYHINENIDYYISVISDFKPDLIDCHPSAIYILAKKLVEMGETLKVPAIWSSCEQLYPDQRKIIEKAFECKIFDEYGQSELVTRACECKMHDGYHLTTELGITEIIRNDPSMPQGYGEIIGTSLRNYAMPFIRYRVGDLATFINYEKCQCNRGMPRIMKIEGRKDDVIRDTSGNRIAPVTVRWTFYDMNLGGYQIQQIGEKDYKVLVVQDLNFVNLKKEFINRLINLLGEDSNIDLNFVENIERTSFGKMRTTMNMMV